MHQISTAIEINAERSVVGSLLVDQKAYFKITGLLSPGDFHDNDCREIFRSVERLTRDEREINVVTVAEDLEGEMQLTDIAAIANESFSSASIVGYARVVQERSRRRQVVQTLTNALQQAQEKGAEEVVSNVMASLQNLSCGGDDMTMDEVVRTAHQNAQESIARRKVGGMLGVSTTVPSMDSYTSGLYGGKMITLGGRPGTMKSALAWQILLRAAKKGIPVGMISLEMGPEELGARAVANVFKINGHDYMSGDESTVRQAEPLLAEMRQWPVWVDYRSHHIGEIEARINEWKFRHDVQLVCVDYLQLVRGHGQNRFNEINDVTRRIKLLAMRLNIPVLCLAQVSRDIEKNNRRPMLADLRESGNIEQDSDIVMFTHCWTSENKPDEYELILAKQRGGVARKIVDLVVHGEHFFVGEQERYMGAGKI